MIDRIYYTDSYLREFPASIVGRSEDGLTVYLDRTAFYPAGGGQGFRRRFEDIGPVALVAKRPLDGSNECDRTACACAHGGGRCPGS